jgi:hypothetical protein
MKRFYYISKNEEEQLDLIELFEYATDYNLTKEEIKVAISKLNEYITIEEK